MRVLSSLAIFLALFSLIPSLAQAQPFTINNYLYSSGGLGSTFQVGPSNLNIPGLTTNYLSVGLVGNVTTTIYIARGLLLADYSLLPLTGFGYSYTVTGLPSWATYNARTASISATPPATFSNDSFEISYTDTRNNSNKISAVFYQIASGNNNNFHFYVVNGLVISNVLTIAFPIFATTGTTLSTIRSSNYGALTNIAQYPWLNIITLSSNSGGYNPGSNYLIVNATGTYVFGVEISRNGYFTNSTGTYLNGIYQGNTGYTTSANGTFLNGNYVGAPGFAVVGNQVYFGGALLSSTITSNANYLTVNSQGTYVNGILISNSGYFTNATGTYNNGQFLGNSGYSTTPSGTYFNGVYVGQPGYVIVGGQAFYGGSLIPELPNWGSLSGSGSRYLIKNDGRTYFHGVPINNRGYFTDETGTYYNGNFQANTGFNTNSTGTFYNGAYVGAPGYYVNGNDVYYGGTLVSPNVTGGFRSSTVFPATTSSTTTTIITQPVASASASAGTGTGFGGAALAGTGLGSGSSGSSSNYTIVTPDGQFVNNANTPLNFGGLLFSDGSNSNSNLNLGSTTTTTTSSSSGPINFAITGSSVPALLVDANGQIIAGTSARAQQTTAAGSSAATPATPASTESAPVAATPSTSAGSN